MIRFALLAAAGVALSFVLPAPAPGQTVPCGEFPDARNNLEREFGETPVWAGVDGMGRLVELVQSAGGSWSLIVTLPNRQLVCLLQKGEGGRVLPRRPSANEEPAT